MKLYSLSDINRAIKQVLMRKFQSSVWVEAEISRVYEKSGHYYLELVEKEDNKLKAKSSAALWRNISYVLRQKLKSKFDEVVQEGVTVKILVDVNFHAIYGHKLIIRDLDPEFTLGKMDRERRKILAQLKKEELIKKNASLPLPPVIQDIAVISSFSAAGYKDFMQHLEVNNFNYAFDIKLFQASMQGKYLKSEILKQLARIQKAQKYDLVCIVRGGGSRVDLSWFDDIDLARKIAAMPIPVVSGIGHEIDKSVTDIVAHTSLKTPTAVSEFIIHNNSLYEDKMESVAFQVYQSALGKLESARLSLQAIHQNIHGIVNTRLNKEQSRLGICESKLKNLSERKIEKEKYSIEKLEKLIEAESPQKILEKGYALVSQDKRVISDAEDIERDKTLNIQFTNSEYSIKPTDES